MFVRMSNKLHGQWIGEYHGSNNGTIIVDIDLRGDYLSGTGLLFDNAGLPGSLVNFVTSDCSDRQSFENLPVTPTDPNTSEPTSVYTLRQQIPDLIYPNSTNIDFKLNRNNLEVSWLTEIGTAGRAKIPRSKAQTKSMVKRQKGVTDWARFKKAVGSLEVGRYIYRGQPNPWRLRTAFHRTHRKDVFRFMQEDIPRLHQRLSGMTKHFFNLSDSQQNGAFWNLIQHHGYPTPLLDWSYSPFVAAFFAYRNRMPDPFAAKNVRIYAFDKQEWCKDFLQLNKVAPALPHFSILESLALENPRHVPQQALSTITNLDDIESYIKFREGQKNKTYLTAYDLPSDIGAAVLGDLTMMGITAGSMFPGLDGTCEEWKYRNFGFQ